MIKYQKPIARNLGDVLPNAQGECMSGTVASTPTGTSCISGQTASGSFCTDGSFAQGTGCYSGITPAGYGCFIGNLAGQPGGCHVGNSPS